MHHKHIEMGIGGLFCDPSALRQIRLARIMAMLIILRLLSR